MPPMFDFASDRGYTRSKNSGVCHEDDGWFSKAPGRSCSLDNGSEFGSPGVRGSSAAIIHPLPRNQIPLAACSQPVAPGGLETMCNGDRRDCDQGEELDGDLHIRVKLDRPFESMLNDGNKSNQDGDLVVEPICDHSVIQADRVAAGASFHATNPALSGWYQGNGDRVLRARPRARGDGDSSRDPGPRMLLPENLHSMYSISMDNIVYCRK